MTDQDWFESVNSKLFPLNRQVWYGAYSGQSVVSLRI